MGTSMTTNEIVDNFYLLNDLIDGALTDENGEVRELTDQEKADIEAWFLENKGLLDKKFDSIYRVIRRLKMQSEAAEAEKKSLADEMTRLSKRAKARENEVDRVKQIIRFALERLKLKKYQTNLFTVNLQATKKSVKPITGFFNADEIPVDYLKRELNPTAINDAVKAGRLWEKEEPEHRGKLFYMGENGEQYLKGVSYMGSEALVIK